MLVVGRVDGFVRGLRSSGRAQGRFVRGVRSRTILRHVLDTAASERIYKRFGPRRAADSRYATLRRGRIAERIRSVVRGVLSLVHLL